MPAYSKILKDARELLEENISSTEFRDEFDFIGFETDLMVALSEFKREVRADCRKIEARQFPKKKR